MHEAKTNLSKLIMLLEKGEDIIIAKAGNPVAKLVSYVPQKRSDSKLQQFRELTKNASSKKILTLEIATDTSEMVDDGLF